MDVANDRFATVPARIGIGKKCPFGQFLPGPPPGLGKKFPTVT
jgi:hypothetical protein